MSELTVQEYVAQQLAKKAESNPEIVALFEEQQEIERLRNELEAREKAWADRLKAFGPYADHNYRVTDLRETRMLDNELVKKNFHDIWAKAVPSDKFLMESLKAYMGADKICDIVRAMNEDEYNRQKSLTLAEFDKAAGDSSSKKKYIGSAYHLCYTPMKKTRIESLYVPEMMKFGSLFKKELVEPEEE